MKRTVALKIIANQLDFLNKKFEGYRDDFTEAELSHADVILTTLEGAGLQPPPMPSSTFKPLDFKWGMMCTMRCNCADCNPRYLVNEWEKE